jgi:hypothetical protein
MQVAPETEEKKIFYAYWMFVSAKLKLCDVNAFLRSHFVPSPICIRDTTGKWK